MRALTVRQPWADLIVAGVKDVENRTWPPPSTLLEWYLCEFCLHRQQRGDRAAVPTHLHNGHAFDPKPDGPFPFRLGIHAGLQVDHPDELEYEDGYRYFELAVAGTHVAQVMRHIKSGTWEQVLAPDYLDVRPLHLGALLGFVTVTGCHNDLADDTGELEALEKPCQENDGGPHCDHWVYDFEPCCRCGTHAMCSPWAEFDGGGVWHWTLADPEPLDEPVPMRGYQGLWTIPEEVVA